MLRERLGGESPRAEPRWYPLRVKPKRLQRALALAAFLGLPWILAQAPVPNPAPTPSPGLAPGGTPGPTRTPAVIVDGREIPVPVVIQASGPTFGLRPLVQSLGGELSADEAEGESFSLRLPGPAGPQPTEVVIGIGSAIVTVGETIVSLSQPPVRGEGEVLVPLDFLRKTYGDVLGYTFEWRPETSQLTVGRRGARELSLLADVVHQQGITTVVLQFSDVPRYQIDRQPNAVTVQMVGDRVVPPPPQRVTDPLVQDVAVNPNQIRVQLVPGAEVESYILENPFRLVLDVHQPSSLAVDEPAAEPQRPQEKPGVRTIVIDPGHGGAESGAVGPSGVLEKDLTLILARDLEARLERTLPVRVILTRNEDITLPHDTRAALANQNQGDLFISIHLNSSIGGGAHGTETYFLSTGAATDARAAQAAAAENPRPTPGAPGEGAAAPDPAMEDLQLILWDLAQSHHLAESQRFANLVQREFNQTLQLRDRGVKQAPFRVLMGAAMPAVLVEVGFVSNADEEAKLQDPAYRAGLIDALARAVEQYKAMVEGRPAPGATPAPGAAPGATPGATPGPSRPAPPAATPTPRPGGAS